MPHLMDAAGSGTVCHKVGAAAGEPTANIDECDCLACLWGLLQLLMVQLTGTLKRVHVVERSKTLVIQNNKG
jgi:hypothetical protein